MSDARKRYAVLVGQADESYQERFMRGFLRSAFANNADVCVFSMYVKYQDTAEREQGDSNIYSLMQPEAFDGVVMLKDSIQTANVPDKLEKWLKESFTGPVLIVEKESELFPYVITSSYQAMYNVVEHMIEKHGYSDIAFLSGKKWHEHSQERLKAYRDCIEKHGLVVNEDRIFYGDFWYQSGESCADQLTSKGRKLPQAVVCANDQMAIGLCKAFTERGIRIPEDVAVASYDSTVEGQTSPKPLTSTVIPAEAMGVYAEKFLRASLEGKEIEPYNEIPTLLIGESCGCSQQESNMPRYSGRRDNWGTQVSEEGYFSIFNKMPETLLMQNTLEDFIGTLYSYCYQIPNAKSFHLCLTNWYKYIGADAGLRLKNDGYPDKMTLAIRYSEDKKNNRASLDETFETKLMLPELFERRKKPTAYFFTPVFYETECFGYAALSYGSEPRSYDEDYRRWIGTVCVAFEALRRTLMIESLREQMIKHRTSKFAGPNSAYERMSEEEKLDHDLVGQILDNNLLTYHFQPIINAKDGSIYSYEALMRSMTDRPISPLSIIKFATMQGRLEDVERATFINVLQIVDKNRERLAGAKVFINSIPGVRLHDADSIMVENYLKANSDSVVVELTEEAELSDAELERLKDYLRTLGIQIAVDDYGTGYSNISNLLRYMPNYVKIDRSLLSGIQSDSHKQHFVREIINFCHDNAILALAEGVETADELRTVIHLGADLIQGYYTGRPSPLFIGQLDSKLRSEIKSYYQEYIDGTIKKTYTAGKTNRVSLGALVRDGCSDIVVGQGSMVYKDISIIGAPSLKTDINLRIEPGYTGRITLENVAFSNVKNRPSIELCENCDVTLVLVGESLLSNSGIYVPESSRLTFEGDGDLKLRLTSAEYFGIGAGNEKHGTIVFEQDGKIEITSRGKNGVCIGSGKGGTIRINKGHYVLKATGDRSVGIGSISGNTNLDIVKCNLEEELFVTEGLGVGSYEGNAEISISRSSFRMIINGSTIVAVGTVGGKRCCVKIFETSGAINMRANNSTCIGALDGKTKLDISYASISLFNSGKEALALGGYNEDTYIDLNSADTKVEVHNVINKDTFAPDDKIQIVNGRMSFIVNDKPVERKLRYDFNQ